MKRRNTSDHAIPARWLIAAFIFQAMYILCVASFVIPEWSVERWLYP
jgi:hypothetical protein